MINGLDFKEYFGVAFGSPLFFLLLKFLGPFWTSFWQIFDHILANFQHHFGLYEPTFHQFWGSFWPFFGHFLNSPTDHVVYECSLYEQLLVYFVNLSISLRLFIKTVFYVLSSFNCCQNRCFLAVCEARSRLYRFELSALPFVLEKCLFLPSFLSRKKKGQNRKFPRPLVAMEPKHTKNFMKTNTF